MTEIERQHHVSLKFKYIKVQVISGLFYTEHTDVVVNSTSHALHLSDGQGSKALLQAAGAGIQSEITAKYPDGVSRGEIAITGGHDLYCALVYHCFLKMWTDSDHDSAEEVLKQIITNSLKECHETSDVHSITFPALGRGFNNFPAKTLAKLMFQCVVDFEQNLGEEPSVKDVRFVVYPADQNAIEALIEEAKQRSQSVVTTMEYSTDMGNIELTLLQGSLIKQVCDVVAHDTLENMDLAKCLESKELYEAAGPDLEKSLKEKVCGFLTYDKIAITGNANLTNCKAVYHGSLPNYTNQSSSECKKAINVFVAQCLMEASGTGFLSISFPPLGTGTKNYPPDLSAEAIQGSIIEFICSNSDSTSLKRIYFVIPPSAANTFQTFKDIMFPYMTGKERLDRTLVAKSPTKPVTVPQKPNMVPALNSVKIIPKPPARGSKQWFVQMYDNELLTPPYWTYFPGGQRVRKLKVDPAFATKGAFKLVDVEPKTLQAIRSLVGKTWNEEYFSHGRDAMGLGDLSYKKIKVIEVKRVENLTLFEKYVNFRQQMFGKASSQSRMPSPDELSKSKGQLLTTEIIDPCLTKDIYPEINEHYVFHGTKQENVEIILATGLDSRMAGPNAMFGSGVYTAESSTKADQYTDYRDKRDMKPKNMFLTRMCMGDICIVDQPIQLKRPPCKSCRKIVCSQKCRNTQLYDSLLVDGQWIFREMIVYDHAQCYPEYLITYQRVK